MTNTLKRWDLILPFQGAYPKLELGNERQGRELSFYKRD